MSSRALPTVDVVTPCRNRLANLRASLPSWLSHPLVRRILVVDFQSDLPVAEALGRNRDPRITVLRVDDEPLWRQGRAQNVGLQASDADLILKLDADIAIVDISAYVEAMALNPAAFPAGLYPARQLLGALPGAAPGGEANRRLPLPDVWLGRR